MTKWITVTGASHSSSPIHVLPAQSICGWEHWACTRREKSLISRKEWTEHTEHLKPLHLGQRQHPPGVLHTLQGNKWGTGAKEQPRKTPLHLCLALTIHSWTELAVKGYKRPKPPGKLNNPSIRWFPACLAGMIWGRTMLGTGAGWISSALPYHQGMDIYCEHGLRNCKKKENQYLQTHRETFHEDLLHFCSKPAALCNGLLCLLFFFFLHYFWCWPLSHPAFCSNYSRRERQAWNINGHK